jgi:hypothetical protein
MLSSTCRFPAWLVVDPSVFNSEICLFRPVFRSFLPTRTFIMKCVHRCICIIRNSRRKEKTTSPFGRNQEGNEFEHDYQRSSSSKVENPNSMCFRTLHMVFQSSCLVSISGKGRLTYPVHHEFIRLCKPANRGRQGLLWLVIGLIGSHSILPVLRRSIPLLLEDRSRFERGLSDGNILCLVHLIDFWNFLVLESI